MHDTYIWSVGLGRWGGVQVRVHALFLLYGLLTIYLGTLSEYRDLVWYSLMSLAILFVSVLLHELAHCYAALRVGGRADEIVLAPLGGLAPTTVPHDPHSELITALAGPAVNCAIWLATVPLLLTVGDVNVIGLLNPLRPDSVIEGAPALVFLKLTFWLNWIVLIVNLLPAYPFDGGMVLRSILWPVFGYRQAILVEARVAMVAAVGMCLIAWLTYDPESTQMIHAWVPLTLIAMFLVFSAKQEIARLDQQDLGSEFFGYDFSQGYTSLEREAEVAQAETPSLLQRWLIQRRKVRQRRRQVQEAAEEGRVDDILARLHAVGMEGLSADERALLQRVSARYRDRTK